LWPVAALLAFPAGAALGWLGLQGLARQAVGQRPDSGFAVVWAGVVVTAGGGLFLDPFYDRYLLPWLPLALFILLRGHSLPRAALLAGWAACAVLGWFSVVGTQDYLAWNEARWAAGRALVAQGVAPEDVDGGYEWIGWHEFRNAPPPTALAPDFDPLYWMKLRERRYALAFTPLEGYDVVVAVSYGGRGGQVLALRRR
jgi:hypothetical protein